MQGGGRRHQCITVKLPIGDHYPLPRDWSIPRVSARERETLQSQSKLFSHYMDASTEQYHRARLLAAAAAHSGEWLSAVPITARGLHLSVAVGFRLCTELGQAHQCACGETFDTRGSHLLVQAQPRENPATSLQQRPSLARNDKGLNSLSKEAEQG